MEDGKMEKFSKDITTFALEKHSLHGITRDLSDVVVSHSFFTVHCSLFTLHRLPFHKTRLRSSLP
jgi:hypothetical protein